jgi:hypothetical protein
MVAAAILGWGGVSARADSLLSGYPIGAVVSGAIAMSHVTVPMPAGPWTVISKAESANNNSHTVGTLYLAQVLSGKFIGFAIISSNADLERAGWVTLKECGRSDMLYVERQSDSFLTESCWWINHIRMAGEGESKEYQTIFPYASQNHSEVPLNLIEVGVRIADRSAFLTARWRFNPELDGISPPKSELWARSEFNKLNISNYPDRMKYIDKMRAYGREWYPLARKGFSNKLPAMAEYPSPESDIISSLVPPNKSDANPVVAQGTVEERLQKLKALFDKRIITQSEYDQKRREVLSHTGS